MRIKLPDGRPVQVSDWTYTSVEWDRDRDDLDILADVVQEAMRGPTKQEQMKAIRREKHREMLRNARKGR